MNFHIALKFLKEFENIKQKEGTDNLNHAIYCRSYKKVIHPGKVLYDICNKVRFGDYNEKDCKRFCEMLCELDDGENFNDALYSMTQEENLSTEEIMLLFCGCIIGENFDTAIEYLHEFEAIKREVGTDNLNHAIYCKSYEKGIHPGEFIYDLCNRVQPGDYDILDFMMVCEAQCKLDDGDDFNHALWTMTQGNAIPLEEVLLLYCGELAKEKLDSDLYLEPEQPISIDNGDESIPVRDTGSVDGIQYEDLTQGIG